MHDARSRGNARGWPPPEVRLVTDTFVQTMDDMAPGLLEGLYLHGSLGFGEWYERCSDIDFVAVLAERPDAAMTDLLRRGHAGIAETFPRPPYDGFHLTWEDLSRSPYDCPDVPCVQAGYFQDLSRLDVHPVTWHELAHHGVVLRGPKLDDVDLWTDQSALRRYTHDNLRDYWREEVEALRRFPEEAGKAEQVAWYVLGVSRLHHLLARDTLTSKTGAGRYAFATFGERWRPLVDQAMSIRVHGEPSRHYAGDRGRDVIDFADLVVSEGLAIPV